MSVYNVDGTEISTVYDISGNNLNQAYDIDGQELLTNGIMVMTFNVQRWWGINADTTIMNSIFNAYKPLICGVQETGTDGTLNYVGTQFQSGIAMQDIPNKPALLFNVPYINYSDVAYTTQGYETRGYQKCYVTLQGQTVAIFNTHMQDSQPTVRAGQAAQLLADMNNEDYCIVFGDFNTVAMSVTDADYINVEKPFIDAGYNMANWASGFTDTWFDGTTVAGSSEKYALDNIITSPNISIEEVFFDQRKIEAQTGLVIDHIPVAARLLIGE